MLCSMKELKGYAIHARDGNIGSVYEFYFDDENWTLRYLVINLGSWLLGPLVLVSSVVVGRPDCEEQVIPVALTREQLKNSPDMSEHKPVSLQQEEGRVPLLRRPIVWAPNDPMIPVLIPCPELREIEERAMLAIPQDDPHLRSAREVMGYHIRAIDGEIGHVEDFLFEGQSGQVCYMMVDTKNWLPGKKVPLDPCCIERIGWREAKVYVDLPCGDIEDTPELSYLKS